MRKAAVRAVAILELMIGLTTISSLVIFQILSMSTKPANVFIFVLVSSLISIVIGFGLMTYRNWAREILLFFSMYIVFTKILIFSGLLQFNGEILAFVPGSVKNSVSLLYHSFVLLFFNRAGVKEIFKPKT